MTFWKKKEIPEVKEDPWLPYYDIPKYDDYYTFKVNKE